MKDADKHEVTWESHPKEMLAAVVELVNLRSTSAIHKRLAGEVSIPRLKEGVVLQELLRTLKRWFPGPAAG